MLVIPGSILLTAASCGTMPDSRRSYTPFNTNAPEIIRKLGRGINLGNDLDPYPGPEGSWTKGIKADTWFFDSYTNAGFDSVRIPVTWGYHLNNGVIDPGFMARVKQLVDWAISRNLYVVLDAHHEYWLKSNYIANIGTFESIWAQISTNFAGEPANLVFEILNEPSDPMTNAQVNDMNVRILKIIRQTNPGRFVMIGADKWNAFNRLIDPSFTVPSGDPYLIANFHYYSPWDFCGNGIGKWGTPADYSKLSNDLISVSNWAAVHKIPVYLGEYGACETCDKVSRLKWYSALSAFANADGFAYAAWDNYGQGTDGYRLMSRISGSWERELLDAIFSARP